MKSRDRAPLSRRCLLVASACCLVAPNAARAKDETSKLLDEVRKTFTLRGKPVPPEIFRDMGDGNLADSTNAWVTVDLAAAIDSNLYADEIRQDRGWVVQTKSKARGGDDEQTAYRYIGATQNGLLVAIASYKGGGSGIFYTLHILDLAVGGAFDSDGAPYTRINLTGLRAIELGDRWDGEAKISGNKVSVTTTRGARSGRAPLTIDAKRPRAQS